MRILGAGILNDYGRRKPRLRGPVQALRALIGAARWKRLKDVEAQFAQVASITPPDRVALDFAEEDLRLELRVNGALGLVRIVAIGPSASKGKQT